MWYLLRYQVQTIKNILLKVSWIPFLSKISNSFLLPDSDVKKNGVTNNEKRKTSNN